MRAGADRPSGPGGLSPTTSSARREGQLHPVSTRTRNLRRRREADISSMTVVTAGASPRDGAALRRRPRGSPPATSRTTYVGRSSSSSHDLHLQFTPAACASFQKTRELGHDGDMFGIVSSAHRRSPIDRSTTVASRTKRSRDGARARSRRYHQRAVGAEGRVIAYPRMWRSRPSTTCSIISIGDNGQR